MKVSELVEKLKEFPQDLQVLVIGEEEDVGLRMDLDSWDVIAAGDAEGDLVEEIVVYTHE